MAITYTEIANSLLMVQHADSSAPATERRKLPQWLRDDVDEAANRLNASRAEVASAEGTRRAASDKKIEAIHDGGELIRSVSRYLNGLPLSIDRAATRSHYGFGPKAPAYFRDADIAPTLLRLKTQSASATPDDAKLRDATLAEIDRLLQILDDNAENAHSGARMEAVAASREDVDFAEETLSRVWHFLCCALPKGVYDGMLNNYSFHPRVERSAPDKERNAPQSA